MVLQYEKTFAGMWYKIFLYNLATSVLIHCIVALLSFCSLRRHKYGRLFSIVIFIVGFLYPVSGGVITSALISLVYDKAQLGMTNVIALFWGAGQALILFFISWIRIMATL